ncbi:MAG: helix-turn-helix domain-containing protein [Carboxylicivirga sp.]|nr:helix-turn-helix domain-containing protein [Carboxylicivirga sp.]
MDKTIVVSESAISRIVGDEVEKRLKKILQPNPDEIKDDKLSKVKAAKFLDISVPTLHKLVKAGKFKEHSLGARKYYLKSELISALKNQD